MFILTTDCTDRLRWALFSVDCVLLVGWNFFLWWIKTISLFKTSSIFCNKTDCTDWCSIPLIHAYEGVNAFIRDAGDSISQTSNPTPQTPHHTPHTSIVILSATKDLFNYFARVYLMFILTTDCTDRLRWALFSVDCVLLVGWNFFLWWIKTISLFKTSSIFCNKTDFTDWCSGLMLYLKPERPDPLAPRN